MNEQKDLNLMFQKKDWMHFQTNSYCLSGFQYMTEEEWGIPG